MRSRPVAAKRCLLLIVISLLAWPVTSSCSDVADILKRVAITPPAKVAFREERHNSMLREPLVLTGYLEYLAPGQMKKVIESPFEEAFTVSDKAVEIERDGEIQKLSLRRSRSLKTLLGGIEAIISGNETELRETFDLELQESPDGWSIHFTPRSKRIARNLENLHVTGSGDVIDTICINLSADEWQKIELDQGNNGL